MTAKSNSLEADLIALIFNKTLPSWMGTLATTGNDDLFVSLHTGDPGEAGNQTTNETYYTGYARVADARTSGGWSCSANTATNTALVQFPQCTAGGPHVITHAGIGTSASGTGRLLYKAALASSLSVSSGIQPQLPAGAVDVEED